jgi:hypothetical protein
MSIIVLKMEWLNHELEPVPFAVPTDEEDLAAYDREAGQPGGVGGYGGPHPDTGFSFFVDAFRIESLVFNPPGADGRASITCEMTSNVSDVPTNGLDGTNSFMLTQLTPQSQAYVTENGVLGLMVRRLRGTQYSICA